MQEPAQQFKLLCRFGVLCCVWGSVYADDAVFLDGDGHIILHIIQEFIAQAIHHGHLAALQPNGGQDGTGGCQRVDGLGKQHAGGLTAHGAGAVQHQTAGGRANGLGQAQSLAGHLLVVQIGVILIAAGGFLIAELQRALEGCQGVKTAVGDHSLGSDGAGGNNATLKFLHTAHTPFVILVRTSSSV